jgi:hypothetical protein
VTAFQKYLDFTETSMDIIMVDKEGNYYVFEMPSVVFTDGRRVAGGVNTDVIAELDYEAFRNPAADLQIIIHRFTAP